MSRTIIDEEAKKIEAPIPLTKNSGKIRIKKREILNEYGIPTSTRQLPMVMSEYAEWQIGYDAKWGSVRSSGEYVKTTDAKELAKLNDTTLGHIHFIGANGFVKSLYELSEYAYYFYQWGILTRDEVNDLTSFISSLPDEDLFDANSKLRISREHPIPVSINGMNFGSTVVKYPLLIHHFGDIQVVAEIKVTEKQRAIGVMPMLYVCIPLVELKSKNGSPLLGRTAQVNEEALFEITASQKDLIVDLIKLFGMLTNDHRHDVLEILKILESSR